MPMPPPMPMPTSIMPPLPTMPMGPPKLGGPGMPPIPPGSPCMPSPLAQPVAMTAISSGSSWTHCIVRNGALSGRTSPVLLLSAMPELLRLERPAAQAAQLAAVSRATGDALVLAANTKIFSCLSQCVTTAGCWRLNALMQLGMHAAGQLAIGATYASEWQAASANLQYSACILLRKWLAKASAHHCREA